MRSTWAGVRVAAVLCVVAAGAKSRAEDPPASNRVRQFLARPLTADSVVQVALLNNQALQATLAGIGVFPADLLEAGLVTTPVFAVERTPASEGAPAEFAGEFVEIVTSALRKRSLGRAFDGTRRFITQVILDLIADARAAFYDLAAAELSAGLSREAAEIAAVAADLSQRRQDAGNIDQLQLQDQQRVAEQARLELIGAQEVSAQSRERLNTVMGLWGPTRLWSIDARFPDLPGADPPLSTIESLALENHLELAAARQEIIAIAQGRGLSDQLYWVPTAPLRPSADGRQPSADGGAGSAVELTLPVLEWTSEPAPPDRAIFLQKQQRYKALAVEVHSKVQLAYARLVSARAKVLLYQQTMVPLQSDSVRQAELRYHAMALDAIELFRIRQEETTTKSQYIAAQRDYWLARSELEHQIGCCGTRTDLTPGSAVASDQTPAPGPTSDARKDR